MRLRIPTDSAVEGRHRSGEQGFTLNEMLISSTIFMLVVAGVVASNLFGLRMIELTEPKQQAAQRARELVNLLSDDISTAWSVEVGTGDFDVFSPVTPGSVKEGNALRIYYGGDTNDYVAYYHDAVMGELLRFTQDSAEPEIVAWGVTNSLLFTGEDSAGNLLTNNRTAMVVGVLLQYDELERSGTPMGPDLTYKGYQFETRVTWRAR